MNNILSVNKNHRLDSVSNNAIFSIPRQTGFLQIGLEVAVTLVSQIEKVIAPVNTPSNSFMFSQMTIYVAFDFYSASAVVVGWIRWEFADNLRTQLVDNGKLADADNVLLTWLLNFRTEFELLTS